MPILQRLLFCTFFFEIVFGYCQPSNSLHQEVDSIVTEAIQAQAFPGCVVYVSKGDSVIFFKAFGHHTYDSIRKVEPNDIYDIASITKVVGGTLALMKLYEDDYYSLDDLIGDYIEKLGGKFGAVTFREALSHQGGNYPWIPFHLESRKKDGTFRKKTVSAQQDLEYPFALSDSLYLHRDFYKKIKKWIRKSEVSKEKTYRYSGLFFYLIPELVQSLTDTSYEAYLKQHFYEPLRAESLTFNPLEKFDPEYIVPTEVDTFFRMSPIHGKVHDEGAIMMRGVSGNAGLFSNASDLAKVWKMLLNEGRGDTTQYLKPQTVSLFTTTQYPNNGNRRALGFDKPLLEYDSILSSVAKSASHRSYGHTGYTGAIAWADPDSDLIFIFLTNRVYPSRTYRSIYELNVRPNLHQLFYDYLDATEPSNQDPVGNLK